MEIKKIEDMCKLCSIINSEIGWNCNYCFIYRLSQMKYEISNEFSINDTEKIRKVVFLGKDGNIYYFYHKCRENYRKYINDELNKIGYDTTSSLTSECIEYKIDDAPEINKLFKLK